MTKFNEEMARIFNAMKVFNQYMGGYELESVKSSLLIIDEMSNEMYEALKQLLTLPGVPQPCAECSHLDCGAVRYAKAAIAKAEGRIDEKVQ